MKEGAMRRLFVMRHAKSSWADDGLDDHSRPLNERGTRDAPRVAQELVARGYIPQVILSSDSIRTRHTLAGMTAILQAPRLTQIAYDHSLYHGGFEQLGELLEIIPDEVSELLVLGHNPGWEEVVELCAGEYVQMTTANVVVLEKPAARGVSWAAALAEYNSWRIVDVLRPKEL